VSLSTFVGSFTVPNATGNKATTGVGFQPKVVLFWGNGQTADAALGTGAPAAMAPYWGIGISSSSRVTVFEADDGVTGNPTGCNEVPQARLWKHANDSVRRRFRVAGCGWLYRQFHDG
jgi:hypothetical protein